MAFTSDDYLRAVTPREVELANAPLEDRPAARKRHKRARAGKILGDVNKAVMEGAEKTGKEVGSKFANIGSFIRDKDNREMLGTLATQFENVGRARVESPLAQAEAATAPFTDGTITDKLTNRSLTGDLVEADALARARRRRDEIDDALKIYLTSGGKNGKK
jgi:hypothetical protein